MERNNLDLSGFPRLEHCENYDDQITQMIERERFWETYKKRKDRENFFKWLMVVAGVVIVIVTALVWTNQLP